MANEEHIKILKLGIREWNQWRKVYPKIRPDLSGINFYDVFPGSNDMYDIPAIEGANFDDCNLRNAEMRDREFNNCSFISAELHMADLCFAYFYNCQFNDTRMRLSRIGSTIFSGCIFCESDLSYSSAENTSFTNCYIERTKFKSVHFVKADFTESRIIKCNVYGISSWDMILENTIQEDIYIMEDEDDLLSVDDIELAQFIYMMIENKNLRRIIDTITSSVVLILGRFTTERKKILDRIKLQVREHGLIPILFDFEGPDSRDVTETVKVLANISRFVIADLTDAKSIPQELMIIVPTSPSLVIYPILAETEREYGMYSFFDNYSWVKEITKYNEMTIEAVVAGIMNDQ
jgi:uncharacterized protein YjbI with pentapeptide repeats